MKKRILAFVLCDAGLMSGVTPTAFSPDQPASRAVIAAALYYRAGSPVIEQESPFSDVSADDWYSSAVTWAVRQGIVNGFGDGTFRGNAPVTREQLAALLWRSARQPEPGETAAFADQDMIGTYAVSAAAWARNQGLILGKAGNRFDPKGTATRAQLAVILQRWARAPEELDSMITLQIGERSFTAVLADTDAARAFVKRLPMTLTMSELNGNEKYNYMGEALPVQSSRPGQIQAGDLMLYGSDCLVLFYRSFSSSYSYTRLGHIENPADLASAVGTGGVQITFRQS